MEEASDSLGRVLRQKTASGGKVLVGYMMAGIRDDWPELLRALQAGGCDAIEVGIPFSDPVLDGAVIQKAAHQALERGTTPGSVLDQLSTLELGVPSVVMTYANVALRRGYHRFARELKAAGVSGLILADMPFEESEESRGAMASEGISQVLLAAPSTSDERLKEIAAATRGFLYCVAVMGVTGERPELAVSAIEIAARAKPLCSLPVLVGVGVSTPDSASRACQVADGVVVGTPLVRLALEQAEPAELEGFVKKIRKAL